MATNRGLQGTFCPHASCFGSHPVAASAGFYTAQALCASNFGCMKAVLRPSKLNSSPLVAANVYHSSPLSFSWHYHQQFELVLIQRGFGLRHIGNSLQEYGPGDLVLMGPGLPHRYASANESSPSDFIVVHFDPAILAPAVASDPSLASLTSLLRKCRRGVTFEGRIAKVVAPLIEQLAAASTLKRWSLLLQIIERLAENAEARPLSSTSLDDGAFTQSDVEPLDRICGYIQNNLARTISVAQVASVAAMSVSTFTRFFRRATGVSFVQYVNEMRLRTAMLLLVETNQPIKIVAHKAGYASKSYFHRKFVAARGVTPSQYRKQRKPQPVR